MILPPIRDSGHAIPRELAGIDGTDKSSLLGEPSIGKIEADVKVMREILSSPWKLVLDKRGGQV